MTAPSVQIAPTISVNFKRINITNTTDYCFSLYETTFYSEQSHKGLALQRIKNNLSDIITANANLPKVSEDIMDYIILHEQP